MIIVERMGNLIHNVVRVLKEAKDSIIKLDTHIIFVLFQTERTNEEVFHPVIMQLFDQVILELTFKYQNL